VSETNLTPSVHRNLSHFHLHFILQDSVDLSAVTPPLCDGDNLLLWGFTDDELDFEDEVKKEEGNASDWRDMCTRILFNDEEVFQPVRTPSLQGMSGLDGICQGCSSSCWIPSELTTLTSGN
jgi:hypothetical protein